MQDKNTQQNTSYRYTTCSEVCDNVIFKNPANDNYKKIMFTAECSDNVQMQISN